MLPLGTNIIEKPKGDITCICFERKIHSVGFSLESKGRCVSEGRRRRKLGVCEIALSAPASCPKGDDPEEGSTHHLPTTELRVASGVCF